MDSVDQLFSITIILYYTIIYNLHINYLQWTYFTQIPHAFVRPLQRWVNHVLSQFPSLLYLSSIWLNLNFFLI